MADRIPGGVTKAQSELVATWFDEHVDGLYRYVSRRVGDDVARDVTSDTFRITLERLQVFDMSEELVFQVGFMLVGLLGLIIVVFSRHLTDGIHPLQRRALVSYSYEVVLSSVRIVGVVLAAMGTGAFLDLIEVI